MNLFEMSRTPRGNVIPVMGGQLTSHIDYLLNDQADRRLLGLVLDRDMKLVKANDVRYGVYLWDTESLRDKCLIHVCSCYSVLPAIKFVVVYIATVDKDLEIATVDNPNCHGDIVAEICKVNDVANIKGLLDKHREMCNDLIIADNNRPEVLKRIEALKTAQLPSEEVLQLMNKHLPK